MTKTLAALAFAVLVGIGAWAQTAGAYNCVSSRYGNQTYTTCN